MKIVQRFCDLQRSGEGEYQVIQKYTHLFSFLESASQNAKILSWSLDVPSAKLTIVHMSTYMHIYRVLECLY